MESTLDRFISAYEDAVQEGDFGKAEMITYVAEIILSGEEYAEFSDDDDDE